MADHHPHTPTVPEGEISALEGGAYPSQQTAAVMRTHRGHSGADTLTVSHCGDAMV